MFQQQPPQQHPQQPQQRKDAFMSSDAQARDKLSQFVYEYLYQSGATKTAEMFKNEFLAHNSPNLQIDLSNSSGPGFLYNWWCVFWDLYSAQPDKKDKVEATQEARTYHKMMFPAYGMPPPEAALANGGMYGPGAGFPNPAMGPMVGGVPPQNLPDGMFPNAYYGPRGPQPGPSSNQASPIPGGPRYGQQGTRSGAPTPSGFPPGHPGAPPPQMMALHEQQQQQLRLIAAQQQRQAQQAAQAGRMQQMQNNGRPQVRPQFNNAQYMESPAGTPPFHNPLIHNGGPGVMCTSAGSLMSPACGPGGSNGPPPGMIAGHPQMGGDGSGVNVSQEQQHFMGMGNPPVTMQSQFVNHHDGGGGTPLGAGGPASVPAGANAMNNNGAASGDSNNNIGGDNLRNPNSGGGGQLHSLLNGTGDNGPNEMKQSPAFSGGGGGVNGGTPSAPMGGGPGSHPATTGPSSVHSQSGGAPASVNQQQSQQQQSSSIGGGDGLEFQPSDEIRNISKIKDSLMDGYPQHQFPQQ